MALTPTHITKKQQKLYSQIAPASGALTRDSGQHAGPLPNCFLSTAAGFDSPWPLTLDATLPPPHMQIALVWSRRHWERKKDGGKEEREWRGWMEAWELLVVGLSEGEAVQWAVETPKGSVLVSEVEGSSECCLGNLWSTDQQWGLKTSLSVSASPIRPQRPCLRGLQWPMLIFLCVCMPVCMGKRKVWVHLLCLLFSLLPGCSRLLGLCVRGEANDVCGCIWRASKKPSSPLLTVFSARRICQFSFSLFVLTLILLSKPWLASLTAAEHRSYSTPTNGTHQCFRPCTWTHTPTHTVSFADSFFLTHTH